MKKHLTIISKDGHNYKFAFIYNTTGFAKYSCQNCNKLDKCYGSLIMDGEKVIRFMGHKNFVVGKKIIF